MGLSNYGPMLKESTINGIRNSATSGVRRMFNPSGFGTSVSNAVSAPARSGAIQRRMAMFNDNSQPLALQKKRNPDDEEELIKKMIARRKKGLTY